MASESGVQPFVTHFQGKTKLTSCDFLTIFRQFDQDGRFCCILQWEQFSIAHESACDAISPVESTVCFLSLVVSGFFSGYLAI